MYCEKCGKSNPENQSKCKHCGTLMPQKTACGGFGDILSYENSEHSVKEGVTVMNTVPAKASEKASPLAPILSIVAIGVSVVAIILSIAAMLMCASVNKDYEEETEEATIEINVAEEEVDIANDDLKDDSNDDLKDDSNDDEDNDSDKTVDVADAEDENTENDPDNTKKNFFGKGN